MKYLSGCEAVVPNPGHGGGREAIIIGKCSSRPSLGGCGLLLKTRESVQPPAPPRASAGPPSSWRMEEPVGFSGRNLVNGCLIGWLVGCWNFLRTHSGVSDKLCFSFASLCGQGTRGTLAFSHRSSRTASPIQGQGRVSHGEHSACLGRVWVATQTPVLSP